MEISSHAARTSRALRGDYLRALSRAIFKSATMEARGMTEVYIEKKEEIIYTLCKAGGQKSSHRLVKLSDNIFSLNVAELQ